MARTNETANLGKWGSGVRWTPLPLAEEPTEPAGETKLHYDYLYRNKRTVLGVMRMNGTLQAYLDQFDTDTQDSFEKLVKRTAEIEVEKPFPHEEELTTKTARLAELNALLDMDKKDNEIVDGEREDDEDKTPDRSDDRDER